MRASRSHARPRDHLGSALPAHASHAAPTVAVRSAPELFAQMVEKCATHVYIEKPGATSAATLKSMRQLAAERDVSVVVGYNKNVAAYVRDGLARVRECVAAGEAMPQITLEHCNEFTPGPELHAFMRGPGGEGMLHNMCCH